MASSNYLIYGLSVVLLYTGYQYIPKFYHSLTSHECKTTVLAIGIASWSGKCVLAQRYKWLMSCVINYLK